MAYLKSLFLVVPKVNKVINFKLWPFNQAKHMDAALRRRMFAALKGGKANRFFHKEYAVISAINSKRHFGRLPAFSGGALHHSLGAFFHVVGSPVGAQVSHFASRVAIVGVRGIVGFSAFARCAISGFKFRLRSTTRFRSRAASRAFNKQGQGERYRAACLGR